MSNSSKPIPADWHLEKIARIAHEVNRAYCLALGDTSQLEWKDAPQWQRDSAINGVEVYLDNPSAGPDHSHNAWLAEKDAAGWKFGPVPDLEVLVDALMDHARDIGRQEATVDA